MTEIQQVRKWLADHLGIPVKPNGGLDYDPPDGEYAIPIGRRVARSWARRNFRAARASSRYARISSGVNFGFLML